MAKWKMRAIVVRSIYHEQYKDHTESPHHDDSICGVFSSRIKACSWACERFENDHKEVDRIYFGRGQLKKYELDVGSIKVGVPILAWEFIDDELDIQQFYMFDEYDLI